MAQVLSLHTLRPEKDETYFIDTNVWFWSTYVASKQIILPKHPQPYQLAEYPRFLERALTEKAVLCHCALTLTELAYVIEKTELDLYRKKIGNDNFEKKEFRKLSKERSVVLNEINVAWDTINQMSRCVEIKMDMAFVERGREVLSEAPLDPYDALYVQAMRANKIDYVVTDDIDFSTVNRQIMITANSKATR